MTDKLITACVRPSGESYVVICDEDRTDEARKTIGRWAADPELDLTWRDAAGMCGQLIQATKQEAAKRWPN